MLNLLLIVIQIALAFYIISTIYLVIVYYVRNADENASIINKPEDHYFEKHIAVVFNHYISEKQLLEQIQLLNNQPYKNYSAYFFVEEPFIELNRLTNIRIIRPSMRKYNAFGLLNLAKQYMDVEPDAVLVIHSNSIMGENFLQKMNYHLLDGHRVIQSQIKIQETKDSLGTYQTYARQFFNLVDRKAMQASGLSSAIWTQGFVLTYDLYMSLNFAIYNQNDKALQADIISRSEKIFYEPDAELLEKSLTQSEFVAGKVKGLTHYSHDIKLGFNLLLEGIRNPSIDKIIFGINYLRPPLYIMLAASLLLATIDLIFLPKLAYFLWVALAGIAISLMLLIKPRKILNLLKPFGLSFAAIGALNDPEPNRVQPAPRFEHKPGHQIKA